MIGMWSFLLLFWPQVCVVFRAFLVCDSFELVSVFCDCFAITLFCKLKLLNYIYVCRSEYLWKVKMFSIDSYSSNIWVTDFFCQENIIISLMFLMPLIKKTKNWTTREWQWELKRVPFRISYWRFIHIYLSRCVYDMICVVGMVVKCV